LDHWLAVAAPVDGFVGFAIGRSIWEQPIAGRNRGNAGAGQAAGQIARRYLGFRAAGAPPAGTSGRVSTLSPAAMRRCRCPCRGFTLGPRSAGQMGCWSWRALL